MPAWLGAVLRFISHRRARCRADGHRPLDHTIRARLDDERSTWEAEMTAPTTDMEPTTHTLEVPGSVLAYDVRVNDASAKPVLLLIGSPMGAAGFGTLARHFTDRTVVTYDPRGVERSRKTDGVIESTPEQHADDLSRVIAAVAAEPVDLFATSGGATNALALVARHPEQVRTLVAHEPPLSQLLPDREAALAAADDIHATYLRSGVGPAMAKFIVLVSHRGPIPADFAEQPVDPTMFGLSTEDDGSRDDPLVGQNIVTGNRFEPDLDALESASSRIVIAVGVESAGQMARRGGEALASRLGTTPVEFPSNHGGFLGGEYGQTGEPDAFAAKLREVIDA